MSGFCAPGTKASPRVFPGMGRTDAESPRFTMAFCQMCVRLSSDDPGAVEISSAACDSHRPLGVRGTSAASTPADGTYLESVRWRGRRGAGGVPTCRTHAGTCSVSMSVHMAHRTHLISVAPAPPWASAGAPARPAVWGLAPLEGCPQSAQSPGPEACPAAPTSHS